MERQLVVGQLLEWQLLVGKLVVEQLVVGQLVELQLMVERGLARGFLGLRFLRAGWRPPPAEPIPDV